MSISRAFENKTKRSADYDDDGDGDDDEAKKEIKQLSYETSSPN